MAEKRPETFNERLPPVVPKVEENIDHLSDELVEILYPGRRKKPFQISIVFDASSDESVTRAVALAAKAASFKTFQEGSRTRHRADFGCEDANALRDIATLVGNRAGTELLVAGKKAPYAHELWLPLMSFFVRDMSKETAARS